MGKKVAACIQWSPRTTVSPKNPLYWSNEEKSHQHLGLSVSKLTAIVYFWVRDSEIWIRSRCLIHWVVFCVTYLRASSTQKPFDLARVDRKVLLLFPILLSTRYRVTSLNFTSSRPPAKATSGRRRFRVRRAVGNISEPGPGASVAYSSKLHGVMSYFPLTDKTGSWCGVFVYGFGKE